MFVLALSLYNTWNRGVFLLCKITNLLIYRYIIKTYLHEKPVLSLLQIGFVLIYSIIYIVYMSTFLLHKYFVQNNYFKNVFLCIFSEIESS